MPHPPVRPSQALRPVPVRLPACPSESARPRPEPSPPPPAGQDAAVELEEARDGAARVPTAGATTAAAGAADSEGGGAAAAFRLYDSAEAEVLVTCDGLVTPLPLPTFRDPA